ncbi:hypothetical protein ABZV92_18770 [Streptomyces rubiginosohelvolus]|uniref:hypothetical protein n=1 Tax=Streptomyces rubiginosohelvolus TaxID=67362 RepID=UPI00339FB417
MIPPKAALPTITPAGTYGRLVQLLTAATQLDDDAAEKLADAMLDQLGLYGPPLEPVDGMCTALLYDADPENEGWVQCDKEPGHDRRSSPLHANRWNGLSWSDDHRRALPAGVNDGD